MLAVTDRATEAINAITDQPGLPDEAGLRISSSPETGDPTGQSAQLALALVEGPEEGDREIDDPTVYVEAGTTAEFLEDKVLDAEVSEGQVTFSLILQPGASPPGQDGGAPGGDTI